MSLFKYMAEKDTTITNAYDRYLSQNRQKEANMGAADILETYVMYGRFLRDTASNELTRIMIQFDITDIEADIASGKFDLSTGKAYLRLFSAPHGETTPLSSFDLEVSPITQAWEEGIGLDTINYADRGGTTWYSYETIPATAYGVARDTSKDWASEGGDFNAALKKTVTMEDGTDILEVDITSIIASWIAGTYDNYGLMIKFPDADEVNSVSFYNTQFFARSSEFFYRRPMIEVRYDGSESTNEAYGRENFFKYSPLTATNTNRLYYYNYVRGELEDIPGHASGEANLVIKIRPSDDAVPILDASSSTWVRTGVYYTDVIFNPTPLSDYSGGDLFFDEWYLSTDLANSFFEGGVELKEVDISSSYDNKQKAYSTSIYNMKPKYWTHEYPRFRLNIQDVDWEPNVFNSYFGKDESNTIIEDAYYKVMRTVDELDIIPFTQEETIEYSKLSYDDDGNYFDLDMQVLEPAYMYSIKFLFKNGDNYVEQSEEFRFRVEEINSP